VHTETGVIAGYSTMFVRQSPMADAGETLVLRAHREQGLGRWLKSELVGWAIRENPQVALVQAWNDENNTAVIALNRGLGFVESGAWSTFEF
jgi:GNAT superfamily N-acetyltransferase